MALLVGLRLCIPRAHRETDCTMLRAAVATLCLLVIIRLAGSDRTLYDTRYPGTRQTHATEPPPPEPTKLKLSSMPGLLDEDPLAAPQDAALSIEEENRRLRGSVELLRELVGLLGEGLEVGLVPVGALVVDRLGGAASPFNPRT